MLIFFRVLLPLLIFITGGLCFWLLSNTAPQAVKRPHIERHPVVQVEKVQPRSMHIPVYSRGLVTANAQLVLLAEYGGRVMKISPDLRAGGRVQKGQLLVQLDDSAVKHDITRVKARLSAAKQQYQAVDQEIAAEQEVRGLASPQPFLQRKLDQAKSQLAAAEAELALAQLQLEKTKLYAPFDAQIQESFVVVGQQVTPGFRLASLYGQAARQVQLPLSDRQLRMVPTERLNEKDQPKEDQPRVILRMHYGDGYYYWRGRLVGMNTQIDPRNRLMYVVAQIDEPLTSAGEFQPDLLVGQLVEAEIQGRIYENIFVLPRGVIHDNEQVWVVDANNRLRRQQVSLLYKGKGQVYIHQGLGAGDRVVVSKLDIALEGMRVTLTEDDPKTTPLNRSHEGLSLPLAEVQSQIREPSM